MPLETVWQLPFVVSGRPPETLTRTSSLAFTGFAGWTFVAPEYFNVLRIPVIRGRDFTDRDTAGAPGVVIINQEMAKRFWPTGDPLNDQLIIGKGMRREYDQEPLRQIVGIVGNVRDTGLTRPARPAMYVPMAQEPDGVTTLNVRLLPIVWMVRTATPPLVAAASIEKALQQASGLPVTRIRSMDQIVAESTARSRFDTWLMTLFGGCALLLSAIGVYGLMAYSVQQRTAEIGIRMALGADKNSVRNMVLRQGMVLAISRHHRGPCIVALVRPTALRISVRRGSTRSSHLHDGHAAACGRGVHGRVASRAASHTTGSGYGASPGVSEKRQRE